MKILMAAMSMDIGGAETHVLELSRALVRAGCEVVVASHGGAFLPALAEAGVRHVTLPLDSRNPTAMLRAYLGLRRLLREEHFDIVHAHARIPAFLCGILHQRMKFRFVTTVHGHFKVNAWLRRMSVWGERTIAISDDLKQYLIDEYGVYPDSISTTINGIDMVRFSPGLDAAETAEALGLRAGSRRIVFVSRMDMDCSRAAELLIEILPALRRAAGDVELVLVGGGNDFSRIAALGETANHALGCTAVHTPGRRTDIERCIALGNIFVGVSRAALEAMAEAKPVVLAGNEGWLGCLTADNLTSAVDTNFCCRGFGAMTADAMLRDLLDLLARSPAALAAEGERNRAIVTAHYSADRMAADCLAVYRSLSPYTPVRRGDVIISGYYGFGNIGDDSLLSCILDGLRAADPALRVTVLAKNPRAMEARFAVRCLGRMNLFAVAREMRGAKLLISGGGSLLQDNTSTKSLLYYLAVIGMAKRRGLPVMLYANGIGPLYRPANRARAARMLAHIDCITLRDPASCDELAALGVCDTARVSLTADPAFSLRPAPEARVNYLLAQTEYSSARRYFAVSLRAWHMLGAANGMLDADTFEAEVAEAISRICAQTGLLPIFIPMQAELDGALCRRLCARAPAGSLLLDALTAPELCGLLGRLAFAVGMRLHLLIYATHMHIPAIGISYDPKVDAFLAYAGQPGAIKPDHPFAAELADLAVRVMNERESMAAALADRDRALADLARENTRLAIGLMHRQDGKAFEEK